MAIPIGPQGYLVGNARLLTIGCDWWMDDAAVSGGPANPDKEPPRR
jgi:hypothetical protein